MKQRRYCSIIPFILSVWPSVSGLLEIEREWAISRRLHKRFQNPDVNCDPLSEIIKSGKPCNLKIFEIREQAAIEVVGRQRKGIKWAIFVKRSTTIIVVIFLNLDNSMMKSKKISDQTLSGVAEGERSPYGLCLEILDLK